ncbi:MAG: HD domain-containing protein, partial [Planctomycetes bacterium]|nr:HD domain-containing protein [Planctomycetota bacterium]
ENSGGGLGGGPGHALSDGGGGSGDGGGGSGGGGGGGGFGGFSCLPGSSSADRDALRIGVQTYQQIMDMLQGVTVAVCRGGKIDFAPVLTQAEKILEHLETRGSALLGLARQDHYDAFTFGHSIRVAIFAMNFARALHASRDMQIRIGAAALLHDVGKSLIPFEILHSTARLSAEERREMSRHAELGAQCLLDHHDSDPLAIAAAFGHHLSPDGTGYPNTVHEQPITWITSIVKICDIYEALTASRPYKSAMPPIRAYRIMLAMGDKLDRGLLKRFIEINGIYPIGQMVELAEGAIAVVKEHTDDPLHPIVMIVRDDDGEGDEDDNELFDLREVACPNVRIILREVLSLQEFRNEDAEEPEASPT